MIDVEIDRRVTGGTLPVPDAIRKAVITNWIDFMSFMGRETVKRAVDEITAGGNVDTGRLRQSVHTEITVRGDEVVARVVADVEYAIYVHGGRGPVVPLDRETRSGRPPALRFTPKGGGPFIFARRVAAFPGNPFLTKALERIERDNVKDQYSR